MSDFLGRVGRITEWVVVSNLENRAVNAACDKAQEWWRDRKHNKHHAPAASASVAAPVPPPPPPPSQMQSNYPPPMPQYQPQQAPYVSPPSFPTPMGYGELIVTLGHVDGLNQWGPLIAVIECNHQRYQTKLGQFQQPFSFPVYQFDYDQLVIWIQAEYQQQTVAHADIPIRVLLNNSNGSTSQQQRWVPLRDYYNGPAGQLLLYVEYKTNGSTVQQSPAPQPPPPYSYYP